MDIDFGLITFGLTERDAPTIIAFAKSKQSSLRAQIHYNPLIEDGSLLIIEDDDRKYMPCDFEVVINAEFN